MRIFRYSERCDSRKKPLIWKFIPSNTTISKCTLVVAPFKKILDMKVERSVRRNLNTRTDDPFGSNNGNKDVETSIGFMEGHLYQVTSSKNGKQEQDKTGGTHAIIIRKRKRITSKGTYVPAST